MKKKNSIYLFGLIIAFGSVFTACSKKDGSAPAEDKKEAISAADDADWEEMDEYHELMAESFHPYKDSGDLAPAKKYADSLKIAAEKWQNSPIPAKVNNDDTKAKLQQLKDASAAFAETAKAGDDKVTGEALTKLHDLFHEVQGLWYGGKEHEHHEGEHHEH